MMTEGRGYGLTSVMARKREGINWSAMPKANIQILPQRGACLSKYWCLLLRDLVHLSKDFWHLNFASYGNNRYGRVIVHLSTI